MKYFKQFAVIFFFAISGCGNAPPRPVKTQLEIRELQTRAYDYKDTKAVMKAVINALQDDDFLIKGADKELGYISASKEMDVHSSSEEFFAKLFQGAAARYRKNSQVEASANISEFGSSTKVRVLFQVKELDNFNMPINTEDVSDPQFYTEFFAKVDKSLFIQRQGL